MTICTAKLMIRNHDLKKKICKIQYWQTQSYRITKTQTNFTELYRVSTNGTKMEKNIKQLQCGRL